MWKNMAQPAMKQLMGATKTPSDRSIYIRDHVFFLWRNGGLLDYTLQVQGHKIQLHKVVLAATSDWYRNRFSQGCHADHSDVSELSPSTVEKVVCFMYSDNITLTKDNIAEIRKAAKYFQIQYLTDVCSQFVKNGEYQSQAIVVKGIRSLWENQQCFDSTIMIDGTKFKVHRVILGALSPYFKSAFSDTHHIDGMDPEMCDVSATAFQAILQSIYTGQIEIQVQFQAQMCTIPDILIAASNMKVQLVADLMGMGLAYSLNLDNWIFIASLFSCHDGLILPKEKVSHFVLKNLKDIVKKTENSEYRKLAYAALKYLVDNYEGLEYLLQILIYKWMKANGDLRGERYGNLYSKIRYCLLPPGVLKMMNSLAGASSIWQNLLADGIEYQKQPMHQRVLHTSEQSQVRGEPSFIQFRENEPCRICSLAMDGAVLDMFLALPKGHRLTYKCLEINNFFILKLKTGSKMLWYLFNPRTSAWSMIAQPELEYQDVSMTHDNKHMYFAGGFNRNHVSTDEVNRYSFKTNKWSTISKLPLLLNSHDVCFLNNGLYVSGGLPDWFKEHKVKNDDKACEKVALKTLYCLDLATLEWEMKAKMHRKHYKHTSHVLKIDSEEVLCILNKNLTIEYYSPSKNEWSYCVLDFKPSLPKLRQPKWTVRGNNIYLIGTPIQRNEETNIAIAAVPQKGRNALITEIEFPANPDELVVIAAMTPNAGIPEDLMMVDMSLHKLHERTVKVL